MAKKLLFLTFLLCSLVSLGQKMTPDEYVAKYKDLAISEMKRAGVPAAITLAQGILETESGNSDLYKRSNNHFGIKCKSNWNGPSVSHDDDAPGECFRVYSSDEDSYRDHSDFLRNSDRYSFLFDLSPTDYKGWATGLRKAGYATNPKYAITLINYIEKYNLEQYTLAGMMYGVQNKEYQTVQKNLEKENLQPTHYESAWITFILNKSKAVQVAGGTSLLAIATKFNIKLSKLLEYNDLDKDGILEKSQIIFLEKKAATGEQPFIKTTQTESVKDISRENGVLVESICKFNQFGVSDIVPANTIVYLQPRTDSENAVGEVKTDNTTHVVTAREGLYSIAKRYGVSVNDLKNWNQLQSDNLQIGQKLVIRK